MDYLTMLAQIGSTQAHQVCEVVWRDGYDQRRRVLRLAGMCIQGHPRFNEIVGWLKNHALPTMERIDVTAVNPYSSLIFPCDACHKSHAVRGEMLKAVLTTKEPHS